MNGRGRGISPDGALPANGRMHAPVPSTSPPMATGGGGGGRAAVFSFAADAHKTVVAAGVENPCLTPSVSSTEALLFKRTFT